MFFTREPIIESIITAREGYKLVIRSSKGTSKEDYSVDAVEIVSFGNSIFYRSLEKPKPFLLPMQDYEVLHLKEARMVLKSASLEGSIKIGGGKEASPAAQESKDIPKKKRTRRKKASTEKPTPKKASEELQEAEETEAPKETEPASYLSKLLPPPPTLIKETLSKKDQQEIVEANILLEEKTSPVEKNPIDNEHYSVEEPEKIEPLEDSPPADL